MNKLPIYGITEFVDDKSENAIYVNKLCAHLDKHLFINSPHKHNTYITILTTQGTGIHQIDFEKFEVKPGAVFFMNPGQTHCWKLSEDIEGWVIFHTKSFFDEIFIKRKIEDFPFFYLQKNHPVVYLAEDDISKFDFMCHELYSEFNAKLQHRDERLGSQMDLFYLSLSRHYQKENKMYQDRDANYLNVKKLQKLIDIHYKTIKSPNEYADMMNMSTRNLSRICTEVLNLSTSELIFERIIIEIKRMLILEVFTISEIAEELGYEDHSYFTRMFKSKVGMTPKEFQRTAKTPFGVV